MTDKFIEKAVCTHCNEPFDVELYASVNTRVNPELELKVLNFDAFEYTCPHCGGKVKVIYDMLYHMEPEGTMIYLTDPTQVEEQVKTIDDFYKSDFKKLQELMKLEPPRVRVVTDLIDLREKILIFKAGLDDRIMELMKSFLILQIHESENLEIMRIFYDIVEGKPTIVIIDTDFKEYHYDFDEEAYRGMEEQFKEAKDFDRYVVNEGFAAEFIEHLLEKKRKN